MTDNLLSKVEVSQALFGQDRGGRGFQWAICRWHVLYVAKTVVIGTLFDQGGFAGTLFEKGKDATFLVGQDWSGKDFVFPRCMWQGLCLSKEEVEVALEFCLVKVDVEVTLIRGGRWHGLWLNEAVVASALNVHDRCGRDSDWPRQSWQEYCAIKMEVVGSLFSQGRGGRGFV